MKHRVFILFFLPTALAMALFIALPIASVIIQSLYAPHEQVIVEAETCGPFGCETQTTVDQEATRALQEAEPLGRFVGLEIFLNRGHLAFKEVGQAWRSSDGFFDFIDRVTNLPFYGAIAFTLTFTAVVTPAAIVFGFFIALGVNAMPKITRGPLIFVSLLPFIVNPLIGSLIIFWMVDARGILGATIANIAGDPNLSLKASTPLTWIMLMVYWIWHTAPFTFVIYYAGLQTVPQDTMESAMIDGATRWERVRYVIMPHLLPLTTFMALILIMDNFRIFEPIVAFNAAAHAQSLSYFIYQDLGGETRLLSSAAATSVLTIICVIILLSPVLVRTWRQYGR